MNVGICQLCYGWNITSGRMSEIGESVGIIAAQSIGEPGTQLTMRTFHTGGIFSSEAEKNIICPSNGRIFFDSYKGTKKVLTKYRERVFLTLKEKSIKIYNENSKNYIIVLPAYSMIFASPYNKVYKKQIIAKIISVKKILSKGVKDIKEIKTNISGQVFLSNNDSYMANATAWVMSGNIVVYSQVFNKLRANNATTKCKCRLLAVNNTVTTLKNPVTSSKYRKCNLKVNCNHLNKVNFETEIVKFSNKERYLVQKKTVNLKEIMFQKSNTEQMVYFKNHINKVGNFLRKSKNLLNSSRYIPNKYGAQVLQKYGRMLKIRKANPYRIPKESKLVMEKNVFVRKNSNIAYVFFKKQKNEDIVQGLPKVEELLEAKRTSNSETIHRSLHQKLLSKFIKLKSKFSTKIAVRKSTEKVQNFLISNVQNVYSSQGVNISRKHIELITKQMTSKVMISKSGNSSLLIGEIVDLNKAESIISNSNVRNNFKYEPVILGISKLALTSQSFVAEACFQETVRVLTKSAIQGRIDWLSGLKENVVLGNIIPAGTGFCLSRYKS